jgi:NADH dehydrogenase
MFQLSAMPQPGAAPGVPDANLFVLDVLTPEQQITFSRHFGELASADENPVIQKYTLPGHPEIFVIGDTAHAPGPNGQPLPGLAPVAKQQGAYVARALRARIAGRAAPGPFRYRNYGAMATIGRRSAVADFGWLKVDGTLAWLLWGLVHVSFLIGFRNRTVVILEWLWSYVTFQSGARLITGPGSH